MERSMANGHELVPPFGKVLPNACKKNMSLFFMLKTLTRKWCKYKKNQADNRCQPQEQGAGAV
jgi:hypothetical protein